MKVIDKHLVNEAIDTITGKERKEMDAYALKTAQKILKDIKKFKRQPHVLGDIIYYLQKPGFATGKGLMGKRDYSDNDV